MMARKISVYEQGASTYVIGTDDAQEACRALGITPETHQWGSTSYGMFARRQGLWRACCGDRLPKDALPGVGFHGRITARAD